MSENPYDDYYKWRRWAYEQIYGKEKENTLRDFQLYQSKVKKYWNEEKAIGILEADGKFIGIVCSVAKEVTDKESYVRRFGLSFEKDIQWYNASSLLDHLSRSLMFKTVLITTSNIPFKLESDIPEEVKEKLRWAKRNYQFHKEKANSLKAQMKQQESAGIFGIYPKYLPKQMKEEQDHARYFLEAKKSLMRQIEERMKNYFLIKENLFAAALLFYIYTNPYDDAHTAIKEIEARRYSAKMEITKTYFVRCSDVKDPMIVFNPEFFPYSDDMRRYYCLALAKDCVGFPSDKDVAIALKRMFTMALEFLKRKR